MPSGLPQEPESGSTHQFTPMLRQRFGSVCRGMLVMHCGAFPVRRDGSQSDFMFGGQNMGTDVDMVNI